jgi:hypothetical protein
MKSTSAKSAAPAKGADMDGEFKPSVHVSTPEPVKRDMGYSEWNFGDQRMQDGEADSIEYVQPGDEGNTAVKLLLSHGAFSSWDKSEDISTKGPAVVVGTEKQKLNK